MDTSLLQTVYFVLGERKLLHFLLIQPAEYVNLDTFYGPLSVHTYIVIFFISFAKTNKQTNRQTERTLAGTQQQLWPITAGPEK